MKQLLLFIAFVFIGVSATAQLCVPDDLYRDSSAGVYPPPRNMNNPDGGINVPACINTEYEFVFTFKVPPTFEFSGAMLGLDSISVDTAAAAEAVKGLPAGLDWGCNPPNCVFDPIVDSLGCLVIYGTPTDVNATGDYPLEIATTVHTSFIDLQLSFPNTTIPNADGDYTVSLFEEGSVECNPSSTQDFFESQFSLKTNPNPFSDFTTIEIMAGTDGDLRFSVADLLGKQLHTESIRVFNGQNTFEFDGSSLAGGIYIYTIENEFGKVSKKMLIQR